MNMPLTATDYCNADIGVTARNISYRDELEKALKEEQTLNSQSFKVSTSYLDGCSKSVALDDIIDFNVDPKTLSEEKHMDKPTIIDLIYKYMRKAHCKKGDAIKRICKIFDYAEHDLAKDIARTKDDSLHTRYLTSYWIDFYYDLDKLSVEKAEKRVLIARFNQRFTRTSTYKFQIKDVIFNAPATIIFWEDGTKTVAKCKEGEIYSPEVGIMVCYFKRTMNYVSYNDGSRVEFSCMNESPNKALSLLSEIATFNTKGGK